VGMDTNFPEGDREIQNTSIGRQCGMQQKIK
jgi:hypothetical protein